MAIIAPSRAVTTASSGGGGAACPALNETVACNAEVHDPLATRDLLYYQFFIRLLLTHDNLLYSLIPTLSSICLQTKPNQPKPNQVACAADCVVGQWGAWVPGDTTSAAVAAPETSPHAGGCAEVVRTLAPRYSLLATHFLLLTD